MISLYMERCCRDVAWWAAELLFQKRTRNMKQGRWVIGLLMAAVLTLEAPAAYVVRGEEQADSVIISEEVINEVGGEPEEGAPVPDTEPGSEQSQGIVTEPGSEQSQEIVTESESEQSQESVTEVLPFGLTGMSESFALSSEDVDDKQDLAEHGVVNQLSGLTEGHDYAEKEILLWAEDEEYALEAARAYNARLASYEFNIAKLILPDSGSEALNNYVEDTRMLSNLSAAWGQELETAETVAQAAAGKNGNLEESDAAVDALIGSFQPVSVEEAVSIGADPEFAMPVVEPNYVMRWDEREWKGFGNDMPSVNRRNINLLGTSAPSESNYDTWVTDQDAALVDTYLVYSPSNPENYQWQHEAVESYRAWGVTTGRSDIHVAVIDSGVLGSHEELEGRVNTYDASGNETAEAPTIDHGTHVAGIIAASLCNGHGGAGIAPGVTIDSYAVANSEGGYDTETLCTAIGAAASKSNTWVINMSLGGYFYSSVLQKAVTSAYQRGIMIFASMGNDGSNIKCYPAACDGVYAVAATEKGGQRAAFSNYGSWCDISAPGAGIISSIGSGASSYELYNGTSMSCPVVSGAAALYFSKTAGSRSAVNRDKCWSVMSKSVTKAGSGMGKGIIDVAKMFEGDNTAPVISVSGNGRATLKITINPGVSDRNNDMLIYTTDGKNPSVKNGEVVNGIEVTSFDENQNGILTASDFPVNASFTLKAARINSYGMLSKITTYSQKISTPSSTETVTSVDVTGQSHIIPGKSASYTVTVTPSNAKVATVLWSVAGVSGVTINSNGKLTVPKSVTSGTLYVIATAGGVASTPYPVTIVSKATSFAITRTDGGGIRTSTKSGKISSITLFNTDATSALKKQSNVRLIPSQTQNILSDLVWTSSNKKVATVDSDGNVHGLKKGKTTITCKINDGSGVKASVTVNVLIPVSSLDILPPGMVQSNGSSHAMVATGCSITLKAAYGNAYGNPTTKKVTWGIQSVYPSVNTSYVKISSKGKLTVNKDFNLSLGDSYITVKATTTDGTNLTQTLTVYPHKKATYAYLGTGAKTISGYASTGSYYLPFYTDATYYSSKDFAVSSSNPKIAGAFLDGGYLCIYNSEQKKGTVTFKVKNLDGSGKTASVRVKFL